MNKKIPVCEPFLNGNEIEYVHEAVSTGWISSGGTFVRKFEEAFSAYSGMKYGVAVTNGTAALHIALRSLGVGPGDEVIIPSFTMIASAFAVCYCGATPVFIDVDPKSWNMDVTLLEAKITSKTKAIMPVHIFGTMCDMDEICAIADHYKLFIVEDAAEAHGAEYKEKKAGSFSEMSAFSFYANKNISTGEGGMVLTNDSLLYDKARYFKNLCFSLENGRDYSHNDIGFNYRMSNIHAAIGLAQTEKCDFYRKLRIKNHFLYRENLKDIPGIQFQQVKEDRVSVHWMNALLINEQEFGVSKNAVMKKLSDNKIGTRLLFTGMHRQKALIDYGCDNSEAYSITSDSRSKSHCSLKAGV